MDWDEDIHPSLLLTARTIAGLTREELADRIKSTPQSIFNWETGSNKPQEKFRDALVQELGADAFDPDKAEIEEDGPTAFAKWVESNRAKARWSRSELAGRVGVSPMTIYNIEKGRVVRPQTATVEKLETVFKQQLPKETSFEIEKASESGVSGVGPFTDFDPHDKDNLPKNSGIYVFYDISDRPIYVGEAASIASRIADGHTGHMDKFWYRSPIVHSGAYVQVDDPELRRQIETTMIKFMKSNAVVNKKGVDRRT